MRYHAQVFRHAEGTLCASVWHDAEPNHQTFVVCAMLHNAVVDYRESAAGAYHLDNVQRFGSSVGDFEPSGEDEKKLLLLAL